MEKEIVEIPVEEIIPNRFQPRTEFDENALTTLSESIKMHGIIQPLVLRRIGDKYEIIAGERRYKASIMAGLTKVPAIIKDVNDNESAELAIVENLQRRNLSAIEEAESYKKLLDRGYLTQEQLAEKMGVTQPTIANKLRLLSLPQEIKDALLKNQISERHARSLLGISDPNIQVQLLRRIIAEKLTVKQTDEEIAKILSPSTDSNQGGESLKPEVFAQPAVEPVMPTPIELTNPIQEPSVQNFNAPVDPINQSVSDFSQPVEPVNFDIPEKNIFDIDYNAPVVPPIEEPIMPNNTAMVSEIVEPVIPAPTPTPIQPTMPIIEPIVNPESNIANINLSSIGDDSPIAINPFQDDKPFEFNTPVQNPTSVEPEIMDLSMPKEIEKPVFENVNNVNPLIEEFKVQRGEDVFNPNTMPSSPSITSAINEVRDSVNNIEKLGFVVNTEEFDFEDMYQVIIKIQKN